MWKLWKKNDIDGAIGVLEDMSVMGFIPNMITYTTILGGYVWEDNIWMVLGGFLGRFWIEGGSPMLPMNTILMDGH